MENDLFYGALFIILMLLGVNKYSSVREENTRLRIHKIESELEHDEKIFQKMLKEVEGVEVDWDNSGIGTQRRRIEQLKEEKTLLKSKKTRLHIFFF